jgi:membrane protein YqaA with SNARE-associated domain
MEYSSMDQLLPVIGLYAGTYLYCFMSGFIPIFNSELFLVGISLSISKPEYVLVLLLASTGQMTAKVIMHLSGKGVLKYSKKRYENKITEIETKMKKWESKISAFIFLSAFTGFPPFYAVAVLSGIANVNFYSFCINGFLGRTLRFGLVMFFPYLFISLIS